MKEKREWRVYNRKRWAMALSVFLFLAVVFWQTETVREEADARVYEVYCLGDSITYGSGLSDAERVSASYPAQLKQLLGARYTIMNYGVPGATLQDTTEKSYRNTGYIEITEMHSPDILLIMLGTNDSKPAYWDATRYKAQYVELVQELKQIESCPYIYLMAPPEAFPGADGNILYGIDNEVIHGQVREIVREVAEQTGVGMIDLYAVTEGHVEYFGDGVHPNAQGYALLAEAVADRIRQDKQAGAY